MPSIIYKTNPATGYVSAYESRSYRDPKTKKPRSKQVYLGRVDPVTHEIRQKGENGKRNRVSSAEDINNLKEKSKQDAKKLERSESTIEYLKERVRVADEFFDTVKTAVARYESEATAIIPPTEEA